MRREAGCFVLVLVLAGALSGCVRTGQLNGRLSVPSQPVENVKFEFRSDVSGEGGKLSTKLAGGESFSGRYVQITSTTREHVIAPLFQRWPPFWNDWGPFGTPWFAGNDYTTFRTNYSGKVVATLFGDRGDTMRCRFRLSDPPAGLSGGGAGECQPSNGGKIDVQF